MACGTTCIDPLQQCCPATPSLGITCTSPLTCDGTTFTCKCSSGLVHCGNTCINTATQCCVSDFPLGQQCAAVDLCPSDGGTCGTGTCATGTAQCGRVCYNTATQCCADSATSTVGDFFNGGCYAGSFCRLDYKLSTGTIISIVGKKCPSSSTPDICRECCADSDCPNNAIGQKCDSGFCSQNGCTTFSCWDSSNKNVCKIDGTGCADCSAGITVRCPTGMCCGFGCQTEACGGSQTCCSIQTSTCGSNPSFTQTSRKCSANCQGSGADPLFRPTLYSTYNTYVYPTCPVAG